MTMSRSLFLLFVTFVVVVSGQRYQSPFEDFSGQQFCATRERSRNGTCCANRIDECSVPIAGTLCYCDDFCEQHINPDCCPDYVSVCKGLPAPLPIEAKCLHEGNNYDVGEKFKDNCNECKCNVNLHVTCETDPCLMDQTMITNINNDRNTGWRAQNYSEFYGRKLKEGLTYRLGTMEPRIRVKTMSRLSNRLEYLTPEFDSRTNWIGSISDVPDQGWCGSSWAVSTASVSSDRIAINSKGSEIVDIAPQHLLSCVRYQQGCDGGHLDNAWRYLNKYGVANEECYPYEAKVGRCNAKKGDTLRSMQCDLPENPIRESLYKMGPAYSLNNETDIMWEILHYGPVQATMYVYADLFAYRDGIYQRSRYGNHDLKGFHSVRLIGWGVERGVKYWLAANSWGQWWGTDKGYFKIIRGVNECEIESYVLSSLADINERKKKRQNKRSGRKARRHLRRE